MKQISYRSLLVVLLFASNIIAQQAQHDNLPNGFLVKFKPDISPAEIRAKSFLRDDTGIREGEYFEHLGIWYIKYEPLKTTQEEALQTLRNDPWIIRSNPIRKVEYRAAVPNDTYFDNQWSLVNTGQTGGSKSADMKALKAWEITSGNNWETHEPIIAVVDDGFDQDHEDLEFLSGGYDAYNDDFDLRVFDHGTHVTGILGAKADNTDGIAGVNWDARIFPVTGSSLNELVVTRAYEHILGLRKQYNSSGGSQGRYIVATNSSFGVPEGDPNDYQNWCAYYDSLGIQGIVNVVSTENADYDVDVVGDVPSGCSSDYLIAVTNTDHNDNRNSNAAYGSTSVDLGAPGTNILSTEPFDDYGSMSGTSMATPHVTGVVGLIYSVLSGTTISNSLTNPGPVALDIIDLILDNVDQISSLSGITTTGGRLNAYQAVKDAMVRSNNHYFSSTATLSEALYITGSSSINGGAEITVPSGAALIIEDTFSSTGSYSTIRVEGLAEIHSGASLNNIQFIVEEDAQLLVGENVSMDPNSELLTFDGSVTIGDDFTMVDGSISVGQAGSLTFEGDADLEFVELAAMPPLYQPGYFDIYGEISFSDSHTVSLTLSPNASTSSWEGLTLFNAASGTTLPNLNIEDASIGVNLSSTDSVAFDNVTIQSPTLSGISTTSTDFSADNITITNSANYGIQISGGTSVVNNIDISGSTDNGMHIVQYASLEGENNEIAGTAGTNEGILIDNASYDHDVGTVGPNGGYDVKAVNYAWGRFIETTWGSGSPDTYADGTSTLIVHDPQKIIAKAAGSTKERNEDDPKQLLLDWADQRRSNPSQATSWLKSRMTSYSDELKAVATILLFDAYLASGSFNEAQTLANTTSENLKRHLTPGVFAQRLLQLALNSGENEELARQNLKTLKSSGMEDQQVAYLERMVNRRYGKGQEQVASKQTDGQPTAELKVEFSNYPNPFNPSTLITYRVIEEGQVTLEVFDMLGKRVATLVNEEKPAGQHEIRFDAGHLSSGIYFYRIRANGFVKTNKLTLIK